MDLLEQDRGNHFDPAVLDAFGKIARTLFDRYSGHEGTDLKDELADGGDEIFFRRHGDASLRRRKVATSEARGTT